MAALIIIAVHSSTGGRNSAVECQLPKLKVEGSIPFARSIRNVKGARIWIRPLFICPGEAENG